MAPYKLEDNIREKLEGREIKPTAEAWEKLEAKMEAKQLKRKTIGWYYIAASFVGILILASVFFSRDNETPKSQIVNENIEYKNLESQTEIIINSEKDEIVSQEINPEKNSPKTKKNQNANPLKPIQKNEGTVEKKFERDKVIAQATEEEKQTPNSETNSIKHENALFNRKIDEVVASVKNLQETNADVTAMEVQQLLDNARRDIQTQQIHKNTKVDAMALLRDVEWELEKSFRDKVFDALGEGFRKIRTAVIERNY